MKTIIFAQTANKELNTLVRDLLRYEMNRRGQLPCWEEITIDEGLAKSILPGHIKLSPKSEVIIRSSQDIVVLESRLKNLGLTKTKTRNRLTTWISQLLQIFVSIIIAVFPKCPLCWLAFLSSIGCLSAAPFLNNRFFLIAVILIAAVNLYVIYRRSSNRGNLIYFYVSLSGFSILLLNFLVFKNNILRDAGAFAVGMGSLLAMSEFRFRSVSRT